jgi:hypothetical protein
MLARTTLERELRRVVSAKNLALFLKEWQTADQLYGAEQALRWALREDAMSPYKAFRLTGAA